ncbi:MAG TPA: dTDP-4-dehydrorhamnose 3,5-epimerase [Miltoncostaeaceae bacterium]|nr:dTDP-4-dehydrorhamnose 3,5-epimerase [Miltoncostaeaceae bacterium]
MRVRPSAIPEVVILEPEVHADERGFFLETFRQDTLRDAGIATPWVQDNHSRSVRGVLRGMHFSVGGGQAKLVRCARGAVWDVAVDIRRGSPTFGRWAAVTLDDVAHRQVHIPVGFAHGFFVLSEVADVVYRCSAYYDSETERAFAWDDPDVAIAWPEAPSNVSARDASAPRLAEIADRLPFVYRESDAVSTASHSRR